jgi:hypothetical protein
MEGKSFNKREILLKRGINIITRTSYRIETKVFTMKDQSVNPVRRG